MNTLRPLCLLLVAALTSAACTTAAPKPDEAATDATTDTKTDEAPAEKPLIAGMMREVATSDRQWTGIAATDGGRVFVNYPLWGADQPFAVGELQEDGSVTPYPNAELNSWAPGKDAATHFVCVQAMLVDGDTLWVLDPASPRFEGVVEGGAKLMKIDLKTNAVTRTYSFGPDVAKPASYLNDVRVDAEAGVAYMTDSGDGAIVVLDLNTGEARRVLDDDVVTEAQAITLTIEGKPFDMEVHSDGIALSADKKTLYFQALRGRTLFSIATDLLRDADANPLKLTAMVKVVAEVGGSDGLVFLDDHVYLTSLEQDAITRVSVEDGEQEVVVADPLIAWPDSFALTRDTLYFTTAQIHRGADPGEPYRIFAIPREKLAK